jgi:aminoglycoside phosphotransferase (APT) family kinase protein
MVSNAREPSKGLVDVDRLGHFMDQHGLEVRAPISITRITKGHSNEVFKVERGNLALALRRPPRVGYGPGAHDMVREYRVLSALGADPTHGVPVPRTYALCEDPEIIGAPFFLMELLDGVVARDDFLATLVASGARRAIVVVRHAWSAPSIAPPSACFPRPRGRASTAQSARGSRLASRERHRAEVGRKRAARRSGEDSPCTSNDAMNAWLWRRAHYKPLRKGGGS